MGREFSVVIERNAEGYLRSLRAVTPRLSYSNPVARRVEEQGARGGRALS